MGYICDSDDGNAAVLLITNLDNGDTMTACPECVPLYLASTLEAYTGVAWLPAQATTADPESGDASDEDADADADPADVPPALDPPQTQPDPEPTPPPTDAPAEGDPFTDPDRPTAEPDPDRPGQFMHVDGDDVADLAEALARDAELTATG